MKKKGYKWKEENAVRFLFAPSVLPSAASLCCSFTSLSFSLFSHCLTFSSSAKTLILIEITIGTYANRAQPWMVIPLGVLVSLPPLGATNRLSNLDQVSLLYFRQFNSFPPLSSLSPCSIQDGVSVKQNFKLLQLTGGMGVGVGFSISGCIYEEAKLGHNVKNWFFLKIVQLVVVVVVVNFNGCLMSLDYWYWAGNRNFVKLEA